MRYDGSNPLHVAQSRLKLETLIEKGAIFDLTEKKPKWSNDQNKYLHVILGYFAAETGNTLEWVKSEYYKKHVNPDIFIREREDKFLGHVKYLRSSADLDSREMSLSIDRFRNFSASTAGIYLPSPEEERLLQLAEIEIERNKEFI